MNSRLRAIGAGIVLVPLLAATVASGSGDRIAEKRARHRTSVSISDKFPAFSGQVKSGFEPCVKRRRVELYRKVSGNDPKRLGSDRSRGSGRWAVRVDNVKSGAYYALAKPKKTRHDGRRSICRSGRSRVVVVD